MILLQLLNNDHYSYEMSGWFFSKWLCLICNSSPSDTLFVSLPVFSDGLYRIDQRSMTGIIVGVCIALACIVMCALILISKGRPRY